MLQCPVLSESDIEILMKSRTNTGPEIEAVKSVLDAGVVKQPPEIEGPRAEG